MGIVWYLVLGLLCVSLAVLMTYLLVRTAAIAWFTTKLDYLRKLTREGEANGS